MTINEIIGRLRDGGLEASQTNRNAQVYVTYSAGTRENPGWFGFRIICDTDATERRARQILSRWYDIEVSGNVWRLRANRRQPVMVIKKGGAPSANVYMYLEAAQANSTVSMVSTLTTAPNLEYSTDGVTWQEWQNTTADDTHTFDTITLGSVGDKVYFRGENPNGLGYINDDDDIWQSSTFELTGSIKAGGNVMSLLDNTMALTAVPSMGFADLFAFYEDEGESVLITPPSMDTVTTIGYFGCCGMYAVCTSLTSAANMPLLTTIGNNGCEGMYEDCTSLTSAADISSLAAIGDFCCKNMYGRCTSLTSAADMPLLTTIGNNGCEGMYKDCSSLTSAADMPILNTIGGSGCYGMYQDCTFDMSDDGTTLNFSFPTPPVTAGEETFSTAYDVADWMGNTNGF